VVLGRPGNAEVRLRHLHRFDDTLVTGKLGQL
jgi:hypothetical protein